MGTLAGCGRLFLFKIHIQIQLQKKMPFAAPASAKREAKRF